MAVIGVILVMAGAVTFAFPEQSFHGANLHTLGWVAILGGLVLVGLWAWRNYVQNNTRHTERVDRRDTDRFYGE